MDIQFFLLVVDTYPGSNVDEKALILIDTGFESHLFDSEISIDELYFMTTLLINSPDPEPAMSDFTAWWVENMEGEISLECIATERLQLSVCRAADLDTLPSDGWSLQTSFVAFCADSKAAYNEAKGIMFDSELLIQ